MFAKVMVFAEMLLCLAAALLWSPSAAISELTSRKLSLAIFCVLATGAIVLTV